MKQIYKVFINNFFILITNQHPNKNKLKFNTDFFSSCGDLCAYLDSNFILKQNIILYSNDPLYCLNYFKLYFNFIPASGGIVKNELNQLLMIHKFGKWDLPKGKMKFHESSLQAAKREIFEETNVKVLNNSSIELYTYHMYKISNHRIPILKKTHWFIMDAQNSLVLPQISEGIDLVDWFDRKDIPWQDMHMSIKDLLLNNF